MIGRSREFPRPVVVVSQCLEFEAVRYNGQRISDPLVRALSRWVHFRPVCPEVAIGLGVPRDPVRLVAAGNGKRLIQPTTGRDVTEDMVRYGEGFLDALPVVDGFILKFRSPSCGIKEVKLYHSAKKGSGAGKTGGLFADVVRERFPDLPAEDEGRLRNLMIREQFLTRLFCFADLRRVVAAGDMGELVSFHARHKLLLLAWNQKTMRELGRMVANRDRVPPGELLPAYADRFRAALRRTPSHRSHLNVLTHALGHFSRQLTAREKAFFLDSLTAYADGRLPLSGLTQILRSWIVRFENSYLNDQVYFEPFPPELVQLKDSGKGRPMV